MNILESVILGIIQGLTEFIPVSSSAHLALTQHFMGLENTHDNVLFVIILHIGSLAAILAYFWQDFWQLFTSRLYELKYLVVGTIPAAVLGLIFQHTIEASFGNMVAICFFLILTGTFLHFAGRLSRERIGLQDAGTGKILLIGLAQAFAMFPGLSRSGLTIGTGLLGGIRREESVRFSFFLGAVAIAGASILKLKDFSASQASIGILPIIVGAIVSFLVSLFAIRVVMFLVQQARIGWFALYCGFVGWILVVLFSTGLLG